MDRRNLLQSIAVAGIGTLLSRSGVARASAAVREWTPADFHERRRHVSLPQGSIAYVEQGSGPVALFLHGWPLNGYQWRGAFARLSGMRRCIAADFMGLGYTDVPAGTDLSPLAQMRMIAGLLDALDVDKVDLVSSDSGTGVALLLAAYHPERVRTLLVTNGDVDTNSPPPALEPVLEEARTDRLVRRFDEQLADYRIAWRDDGIWLGTAYTQPSFLTRELLEVYLRPLVSGAKRRRQSQDYGLQFVPSPLPKIKERLSELASPARMVWGTADPLFPTRWAYWLDRTLPGSRGVAEVRGAKLFFPEEMPDLLAREATRLWGA